MKKLLNSLILLSIVFVSAKAIDSSVSNISSTSVVSDNIENSQISGRVVDKNTGEALTGVEIEIMGTNVRTYTDFDGNFKIKGLTSGAHAVYVKYISYKETVENINTNDNAANKMVVKLKSVEK